MVQSPQSQPVSFSTQQGFYFPRVWGQGMGQNGMPFMPYGQQQPPMPPQMGMPPMNQMPFQGQMPPNGQNAFQGQMSPNGQNGIINHPLLDEKGNFDFNKVMGHADNINKFINSTKPMIKQLSPLFNMFKGY